MTVLGRALGALGARRLRLAWMPRVDRSLARVGLAGAAGAGAGVVAVGLGEPAEVVVTVTGQAPVVATWVVVVAYLGLALSAILLLRADPMRRPTTVGIGLFLALLSIDALESALRPLDAALDDLGFTFALARVLALAGLACGTAVAASSGARPVRTRAAAATGFVLLLIAHMMALAGAAGVAPDTVRAALVRGMWDSMSQLSAWLLLFAAWQLIEGLHASVDLTVTTSRRARLGWLLPVLVAKLGLIVMGFLVLSPVDFPDWEAARVAHPFAWAYALVVAAAAGMLLRRPIGPRLDRTTIVRAALIVIGIWTLPFLAGFTAAALGKVALLLLPSSFADVIGLLFAATAATLLGRWLLGARTRSLYVGALGVTLIAAAVASPTAAGWFREAEARLVARLGIWVDALVDSALEFQAWALLLLPIAGVVWMAVRRRSDPLAVGLVVVGIWLIPRATSVVAEVTFGTPRVEGLSPNLLMLDVAITLAAAWYLWAAWRRERRLPDHATGLGILVGVITVVTYGTQFGGPAANWISDRIAAAVAVDPASLAFVLLLVVPGIYGVALDSKELNEERSAEKVFLLLGASCLLFVVALVLIPLGTITADAQEDELIRTLTLPGLALVAALAAVRGGNTDGVPSRASPEESARGPRFTAAP